MLIPGGGSTGSIVVGWRSGRIQLPIRRLAWALRKKSTEIFNLPTVDRPCRPCKPGCGKCWLPEQEAVLVGVFVLLPDKYAASGDTATPESMADEGVWELLLVLLAVVVAAAAAAAVPCMAGKATSKIICNRFSTRSNLAVTPGSSRWFSSANSWPRHGMPRRWQLTHVGSRADRKKHRIFRRLPVVSSSTVSHLD